MWSMFLIIGVWTLFRMFVWLFSASQLEINNLLLGSFNIRRKWLVLFYFREQLKWALNKCSPWDSCNETICFKLEHEKKKILLYWIYFYLSPYTTYKNIYMSEKWKKVFLMESQTPFQFVCCWHNRRLHLYLTPLLPSIS